jgi:hypothetical protein
MAKGEKAMRLEGHSYRSCDTVEGGGWVSFIDTTGKGEGLNNKKTSRSLKYPLI